MCLSFYDIVLLAKDLDITDVNYMYRSNLLEKRIKNLHKREYNLFIGIAAYFFNIIKYNILDAFRLDKNYKKKKQTVLFFVGTINQRNALEPIIRSNYYESSMISDKLDACYNIPMKIIYLYSLIFIPLFIKNYYNSDTFQKWTYRFIFPHYILAYGYYVYLYKLLRYLEPKAVVMSNDHNMINRVILSVSKQLGFKTIYLQHASISNIMPPMEFDFALLEGHDALKKYSDLGIKNTKIFLVGNIKYSPYKRFINRKTKIDTIGICITQNDKLADIDVLCGNFERIGSFEYCIRPHPNLQFSIIKKMAEKYGCKYSNPSNEISFDFLKRVDAIIVSNSNIILEAALMNVTPIIFQPSVSKLLNPYSSFMEHLQYEGFININRLISYIESIKDDKPDFRDNAKYFCDTIGTEYDGKSQDISQEIINNIVNCGNVSELNMKKSRFANYEYYSIQ